MSNILYFWIGAGVVFILLEMMTVTLYGLSMSLASFIVALYVFFTGDHSLGLAQVVIFTVISTTLIFLFPKFFDLSGPSAKVGAEVYIGKKCKLKKVGKDWKVNIDGVDYLVTDESVDESFEEGKKVVVEGLDGSSLIVRVLPS